MPGEKAKVVKIGDIGILKRRLLDLGVLGGEVITALRVASLGDPMEIDIKNQKLSIRKSDADHIEVEKLR